MFLRCQSGSIEGCPPGMRGRGPPSPSSCSMGSRARRLGSTSYSCTWGPASENLTRFCSAEEASGAGGAGVSGPAQQGRRHTSVRQTAGGGGGGRLGPHKRALLGPIPCNRWSARHAVGPLTLEPELEDILPRCRARRRWPGSALSREAERDDESGTLTAISVVAAPASPWPGSRVYRAAGKNRGALTGLQFTIWTPHRL